MSIKFTIPTAIGKLLNMQTTISANQKSAESSVGNTEQTAYSAFTISPGNIHIDPVINSRIQARETYFYHSNIIENDSQVRTTRTYYDLLHHSFGLVDILEQYSKHIMQYQYRYNIVNITNIQNITNYGIASNFKLISRCY